MAVGDDGDLAVGEDGGGSSPASLLRRARGLATALEILPIRLRRSSWLLLSSARFGTELDTSSLSRRRKILDLVSSLRRMLRLEDSVPTSHQVCVPIPISDCVSGTSSKDFRLYRRTPTMPVHLHFGTAT